MAARPEIDAIYAEAVQLADRARVWFDGPGLDWREGLPPAERTAVATLSLALTGYLMAVIAWALDPRQNDGAADMPRCGIAGFHPLVETPVVLDYTPGAVIAGATRRLAERVAALNPPDQGLP